jgi:predicted alpha/beta hydrolase
MKRKEKGKRYAAMLLFQFRVMVAGNPGIRRICERRLINFRAANGPKALTEAKRRGRAAQHSYRNSDGNRVHFDFVGVQDLLCLGIECEADEVWYDIVQLVKPMERKKKLIPQESTLTAIRNKQ